MRVVTAGRLAWAVAQVAVGVAMAATVFFFVTGFLWWLALNLVAGLVSVAAGLMVSRPDLARRGAMAAAILFAPVNLVIGIGNVVTGVINGVVASMLVLSAAQVFLAWDATRWTRTGP
jgi:hypothetical protein